MTGKEDVIILTAVIIYIWGIEVHCYLQVQLELLACFLVLNLELGRVQAPLQNNYHHQYHFQR